MSGHKVGAGQVCGADSKREAVDSTDIAARIRAWLYQPPIARLFEQPRCEDAIRAVLDICDRYDAYPDILRSSYVLKGAAGDLRHAIADSLGISDSPAPDPSQTSGSHGSGAGVPTDWHRIAVQVARYGGSYYGLSKKERVLLEAEVAKATVADEPETECRGGAE